jgi:aminoglycoside phosphotransferase (APT) family kinase protein
MSRLSLEESRALSALRQVTRSLGIPDLEAELMGPIADNAVFRLPRQVVARVSTADVFDRALREVQAGRWLAMQAVPAVRPLESIEQPVMVDGHVVTFWQEVPGASTARTGELGDLLRQLHQLPLPADFEILPLDPFVRLDEHLASAEPELDQEDSNFLSDRLDELRGQYYEVSAGLAKCVIHGDANRKNAIRGDDGVAVLLDFERFSIGPREWDLVVPAVYRRLGWYSEAEYAEFVGAYGWDVREWSGFEVFAALREFRMTAWLLSRLAREPRLRDEATRRIASLRSPTTPRAWTPGT